MSWNAELIDGPLENRRVCVDEEGEEPPSTLEIEGHRYVYCGFSSHTPRYRYADDASARAS